MNDQSTTPASGSQSTGVPSNTAGAGGPFNRPQPAAPDRAQGYRPAPAWQDQVEGRSTPDSGDGAAGRQQAGTTAPQKVRIGDVEFSHDEVNDALRFKAETDIRKRLLPATPDNYEIKLPADFQAPDGVRFELDPNSAELKNFQRLAYTRGMDQETFSQALGITRPIGSASNNACDRA